LNRSSNRRPGSPPTSAAWSASPIPDPAALPTHRHDPSQPGRHRSAARLSALQSPSAPYRCRPSPCDRLSRPRSTTATPPRPARSVDGGPIPTTGLAARRAGGNHTRTGPVFTAVESIEEEPGSAPLRPRRAYAADLQHGLPGLGLLQPGKFPATATPPRHQQRHRRRWQVRTAPGPDPPGSSRFSVEGRYDTGSSRTPLDHAHQAHAIWQY
jgi:hypothetical protein